MRKYFYKKGSEELGPFTIEELGEANITEETPVWFQGLGDWQTAGSIEELKLLFHNPIIYSEEYFYTDGNGNTFGPFMLDELSVKNITLDTLVWTKGLKEWVPARSVPELRAALTGVFAYGTTDQKAENKRVADSKETPPKTWLVEAILVTLFCCWPFGIAAIVNAAKVESRFYAGDIEASQKASDNAKKWATWSFWMGLGIVIFYVIGVVSGNIDPF